MVVDRSTQPWPIVTYRPIIVAAGSPVGDVLRADLRLSVRLAVILHRAAHLHRGAEPGLLCPGRQHNQRIGDSRMLSFHHQCYVIQACPEHKSRNTASNTTEKAIVDTLVTWETSSEDARYHLAA